MPRMICPWLLFFVVGLPGPQTLPGFPSYVGVPPGVHFLNDGNLEVVDYKTQEFPASGNTTVTVSGKYYFNYINADASLAGDWSNPVPVFTAIKNRLLASGWTQEVTLGRSEAVFRFTRAPVSAWAHVAVNDETTSWIRIVETAAQTTTLALPAPAATPEDVAARADFPYLAHYPGTSLVDEQTQDTPLDVSASADPDPVLVGAGHVTKYYARPDALSPEQFLAVYTAALTQAGWTVVARRGALIAHYVKGTRDIWAMLTPGEQLAFSVADVGRSLAPDALKKALDAGCHVPIYGITFDFNKATLRADAEPTLTRVLGVLTQYPDLTIELQGHTDNVGARSSNQTLSEQRAAAVRTWLVGRGIPAARLTSRGYADTVPVAPNSTVEGRARNRRVELARPGCQPAFGERR
jgi:OmpA-OmpF porin, OOP family